MQAVIAVVAGLMVSAPVVAQPLVEGGVRRSSDQPVEVFDWTNLPCGILGWPE